MSNCDTTTGVAYGVLSGNHVPMLDQEIFENGKDETYEAWRSDIRRQVELGLKDPYLPEYDEDDTEDRQEAMEELLRDVLNGLDVGSPGRLVGLCEEFMDIENGTFDVSSIADVVEEAESSDYQCDEPEHSWVDGETHYLRGHLGGAALIWVSKSRFVTPCRSCSPCVPGAGSLDSCTTPENANNLAYCPPPSEGWIEELDEDERPYVIYHTDEKGFPTEEVAWSRPQD